MRYSTQAISVVTKDRLKRYLYDRWDVQLEQLVKELSISKKALPEIRRILLELEGEGWIIRGTFEGQAEYSPGDAQYEQFNIEAAKRLKSSQR